MMTPLLLIAALTPLAKQEITPAKHTPLTVPFLDFGVEARVSGTVLRHEGKPAQGARVSLFHQFYGWNGGYETLATTVTDSAGKFELQDLRYRSGNSYLQIQVDEHHAVLTEPVQLATGGTCHVGELQAMALTVLEGTVSIEASLDSDPSKRRGLQLLDEETQRVAGYCWIEDGRFRITGFPKKPLSLRFLEGKSLITQPVDFTERPTVSQVHLQISADEIVLSAITPEVAMTDDSLESTTLAGIIVDAMGDPLPGLEVHAYPQDWRDPQSDPGSITITDETGAFRLTIRDFEPVRLWVYSPLGAARVEFKPVGRNYSREVITVEPAGESMQIQLRDAKRLDFPPTLPNAHGNDVPVAYFGFGASGWRPVDHQSAGIRLGELHRTIMVHIPGRFPRAISPSRYPRSGLAGVDQEELRTLRVQSNGRPVPGTRVYLKQTLGQLEAPFPSEVLLGELHLDDQGQFVGYAPKGVHYVAIVTAPGCSPHTVTLFGERTVEVELHPLPPAITLAGAQPGQSIVIQSAINGQPHWTQRRIAKHSQALSASLPPGRYDLVLLDANSEVVAGQTFSVRQDQEAVGPTRDANRPRDAGRMTGRRR